MSHVSPKKTGLEELKFDTFVEIGNKMKKKFRKKGKNLSWKEY